MRYVLYTSLLLCFLIGSIFSTSCGGSGEPEKASVNESEMEKYRSFAGLIEKAVNDGDGEFIDLFFDFDTIVEKIITEGKPAPEYYSEGFRTGVTKGYSPGALIVGSLGEDGAYKLIKVEERDGKMHAIFRTVSSLGLNYHDFELKPGADNQIVIDNYYSYLDAEDFGKSIQRLYDLNLAQETDDTVHVLLASIPKIEQMATLAEEGKFEQSIAIFDALPKEIQEQKLLLTMLLNMGYEMGPTQLERSFDRFRKFFPTDPLINLKKLEFAIYDKDSTRVFESLDNIRDHVGPDPYLNIIKASVLRDSSQFASAKRLLIDAIDQEEDNDEAYWLLIDVLVELKDHEGVVTVFDEMQSVFEVNAADYTRYDDYPALFASKEYKSWIEANPLDTLPFIEPDQYQEMMKALENQAAPSHSGHDHDGHDHHGHQH